MRRALPVLVLAAWLGGCSGERPRPGPVDPEQPADLAVQIQEPLQGQTVLGDHVIQVRVAARDLDGAGLTGVGMVARIGASAVDSQVVTFTARADTVHSFDFDVPNTFPTNTQIDVRGLAFGTGNAVRASEVRSLILIQCTPQMPICQ